MLGLILASLLLGRIAACCEEVITKNGKLNCCSASETHKVQIRCEWNNGSSWFNVYTKRENELRVDCGEGMVSGGWDDLRDVMKNRNFGQVDKMFITECPAPTTLSFKQVLDAAGVTSLEFLKVTSGGEGRLTRESFGTIKGLETLVLLSNDLSNASADLLADNRNLNVLELERNRLSPPIGIFQHRKLRNLNLGANGIVSLTPRIFKNLTELRRLELWDNRLRDLNRTVFTNLDRLERLELQDNAMPTLYQDVFEYVVGLRIIDLSLNNFSYLPQGLFDKNRHLERVKIIHNLRKINLSPGLLSNLSELQGLWLESSMLRELPEDLLAGSSNLSELHLENNRLETVPERLLWDSSELLNLDLCGNTIGHLPELVFSNLTKLRFLNLSNNHLTTIPSQLLSSLEGLEVLRLDHNRIKTVESTAFSNLRNLRTLWLHKNQLRSLMSSGNDIGESVLSQCPELEQVKLNDNELAQLYPDWGKLPNLKTLDLANNKFTKLKLEDLKNVNGKLLVNLTKNGIEEVEVFQGNEQGGLLEIWLGGNNLSCDCRALGLAQYMRRDERRLTIKGGVKCQGWDLQEVPLESLTCEEGDCPVGCRCKRIPAESTLRVDCSDRNLTSSPDHLPPAGGDAVELDLSHNWLEVQPTGPVYRNLTRLDLSHNHLFTVNASTFGLLLKSLRLDHNRLTHLGKDMVDFLRTSDTLEQVRLDGNPFVCDCSAKPLVQLVQTNFSLLDIKDNITCGGSLKQLKSVRLHDLCPVVNHLIGYTALMSLLMASLLCMLFGVTVALCYRYKRRIKFWLFTHNFCRSVITEKDVVTEIPDRHKQYHAFVSFSHEDEDFVVSQLVPGLEGFKLCLHYRDWEVGHLIEECINRSVARSRKTLVVLSPAFLRSEWGRLEFKTARQRSVADRINRVLIVLYKEVKPEDGLDQDMLHYLNSASCIRWADQHFWEKLKTALSHSS